MTRVLYLLGPGRTGSTLLSRWLGVSRDVLAVGEIQDLWGADGLKQRCSCGTLAIECDFWGDVLEQWASTLNESVADAIAVQRKLQGTIRTRHLFGLIARRWLGRTSTSADHRAYVRNYVELLNAVEGGCPRPIVILDSSKRPAEAYLLADERKLLPVLVIRHPADVVSSYSTVKQRQVGDTTIEIDRKPLVEASALWTVHSYVSRKNLGRRTDPAFTVRYEDFVADKLAVTNSVLGWAELAPLAEPATDEDLGQCHLIGGNPDRFFAPATYRRDPPVMPGRLGTGTRRALTRFERVHHRYPKK